MYQQSSYDLQFLRYLECDRLKLVIWLKLWVISCPFILPLKTPKNQNFEKMKKLAGDIITLHKCTKNHNHMRYSSWDREWDRQCFFGILGHFLPFYDPNNEENQNLKKKKTMKKASGDVITLHFITIIWCMLPEILRYGIGQTYEDMIYGSRDIRHNKQFFVILNYFLPFYTPVPPPPPPPH